ncbi:hypothetical protein [Terrimonas alba]|uniref:hypothetical protein n=1 Tax=Terrimonas alba TaxID=3349636 RepID=UPI0035F360A8
MFFASTVVMQFKQGSNRNQTSFTTLDQQVTANNAVRIIDAFVDKLDLQKLGLSKLIIKAKAVRPLLHKCC